MIALSAMLVLGFAGCDKKEEVKTEVETPTQEVTTTTSEVVEVKTPTEETAVIDEEDPVVKATEDEDAVLEEVTPEATTTTTTTEQN